MENNDSYTNIVSLYNYTTIQKIYSLFGILHIAYNTQTYYRHGGVYYKCHKLFTSKRFSDVTDIRRKIFSSRDYGNKTQTRVLKTKSLSQAKVTLRIGYKLTRDAANHYNDVIMGALASQITSIQTVYLIVYSDANKRKHQSTASLAFVRGLHRGRWIPRTNGQLRGKCFHLMTSSFLPTTFFE